MFLILHPQFSVLKLFFFVIFVSSVVDNFSTGNSE